MKKVLGVQGNASVHWVGDGFPVRSLFSYQALGRHISPFLLLDYAGPHTFAPGGQPRGVGSHPHRGFETVTIVYSGEVAHRDSTGEGGVIGPGDVQWMTAGSGILHEEFHSPAFTGAGGTLEMVQLWVNLPARDKMTRPGYQAILDGDIPEVGLPGGAGTLRVIAGEYLGRRGPAHTFTPVDIWDLRLNPDGELRLALPANRAAAVVVLRGTVLINGEHIATDAQVALLDRDGTEVSLQASAQAKVLLLSGEPIDEPIVAHGPFVMNTRAEIEQAMHDYGSGRFGRLASA